MAVPPQTGIQRGSGFGVWNGIQKYLKSFEISPCFHKEEKDLGV